MCNSRKTPDAIDATYLRKIKKPMIEKRRRDRMNRSLDKLKEILMESNKENKYQFTKLDKAEILEMTLTHIQQLHHQQRSIYMATDAAAAYEKGYRDCTRQTMTYLSSNNTMATSELSRLSNHLHNAINEKVNANRPIFTSSPTMMLNQHDFHKTCRTMHVYQSANPVSNGYGGIPAPAHGNSDPHPHDLLSNINLSSCTASTASESTSVRVTSSAKPWRPW